MLSTIAVTVLPDCDILPKVSAADDTVPPVTEQEPLAWFEFDNGIQNMLNNGVNADIVNEPADQSSLYGTDGTTSYLDLNNKNAYLSLSNTDGSGVLAGMAEVAVEMRIKTQTADTTQWVFYAGSSNNPPSTQPEQDERYLSVHLDSNATKAVARRYNKIRPNGPLNSGGLSANLGGVGWYTLKVVYEAGKTTLSVKDDNGTENVVFDTYLSANVWECVGDILWFGYSGWGKGEYFNGCIDYIKIWGTPNDGANVRDNAAAVENKHIITEKVADPENTVVNMFDYWVFGNQGSQDYRLGNTETVESLITSGINKGHLFLFDGSESFNGGNSSELGLWNNYGFDFDGDDEKAGFESKWGIVQKRLYNGYPRLALESWDPPSNITLQGLWDTSDKKDESLDYLFDPEKIPEDGGKASYPNVTGLFRIDDDGYYYFRSQDVFAELNREQEYDPADPKPKTSTDTNKITLYDTPWREEYARGQFFPFNDWTNLFYEVNGNIGQWGDQGYQINHQPMNHWFGMSIETEFMQMSGDTDMTFEFSGDDDVWIFIDDVLVADVGGNHSRIRVTIDFSTGDIKYWRKLEYDGINGKDFIDPRGESTLYKMFEDASNAGALSAEEFANMKWRNNATFADGTMHTLKFFYLERGNAASNCNISFNLQNPIVDRIRKVDQNGDPLEGAEFALYEAITNSTFNGSKQWHTSDEFMERGAPITTAVSGSKGYAQLTNAKGEPLTFNKDTYYILKETKTPAGYRGNPPIVLKYHENTKTLTVVNKYEAGAYASFVSDWTYSSDVYPAKYNDDGTFSKDAANVTDQLTNGLAIVVPVIRSKNTTAKWYPMYGSNTLGWNTVEPKSNSQNDLIKALAEAAFMQITDADPRTQHWYLNWDGARLRGQMENLPGDATRYVFNGGNDGELVTLFLSGDALKTLGLTNTYANDDERYKALSETLKGKTAEDLVGLAGDLKLLYTGDNNFYKNNRTVIYVPNERRELWVRKVDEYGDSIKGAEFALFKSPEDAAAGGTTTPVAFGTTDESGMLVFRADAGNQAGYAQMDWDYGRAYNQTVVYWLKEIAAPEGYELNESLIRVEVNNAGVYANATGFGPDGQLLTGDSAANDGIKVEASLGRLTQTLVKYAEGIVDETLTHITTAKQTSNSSNGAINSWADANGEADSKALTYDKANGYGSVMFEAENGYVRVMPRQTQGITSSAAKRDNLNGIDLDGLFSLINTVVVTDATASVTDPSISTGGLTVTKTVKVPEGEKIDTEAEFAFTVTLSDKTFKHTYKFTNGKTVTFDGGVAKFTLRHGESVTFTGIPADVTYKVVEDKAEGYSASSTGSSGNIAANKVSEAVFTNTKIKESDSSTPESSDSEETDQKTDEPSKPSTPKDNPNTGLETGLGVGLIIIILLFITVITAVILRRKRDRHQK